MEFTLIQAALKEGDISKSLFQGSASKDIIIELQRLLFELGFKRELKLDKYIADGDYGPATVDAVAAFAARNKFKTDGVSVSNTLAKLILQRHDFLPEMYIYGLCTVPISELKNSFQREVAIVLPLYSSC